MRKIIIFDLKNTLIDSEGAWVPGAKEALYTTKAAGVPVVLYSMNEPWTYKVLSQEQSTFCDFTKVLLVNKKAIGDITEFANTYEPLVIGDSDNEELYFGRKLGYKTVKVDGRLKLGLVNEYLLSGEPA